jgi:pyruvate kinase
MDKKRTKIVATISSRNCSPEFIQSLYDEGMNVVRINSAHLGLEEAKMIIDNVRSVSDRIAVIIDTKGPEIRTTICDNNIKLMKGNTIAIKGEPDKKTTQDCIYVTYKDFVNEIAEGTDVLIDDGEIELRVVRRNGDSLECSIENDGNLGSRKSVNIPGSKISSVT